MIQIGIRSPMQREVFDWTIARGVTILSAQDVHEIGAPAVAERVRAVVTEGPLYLSFDIDALDPAFAPGTGTPEFGGLARWQAQAILRRLNGLPFVGMELALGRRRLTMSPKLHLWLAQPLFGSTCPSWPAIKKCSKLTIEQADH